MFISRFRSEAPRAAEPSWRRCPPPAPRGGKRGGPEQGSGGKRRFGRGWRWKEGHVVRDGHV